VVRLVVIARHAESAYNAEQRVNGDPRVHVPLTPRGEEEARLLGAQLAGLPVDLCVHTRFERTQRTAELALAGREVPLLVEPLLDDLDVGSFEGAGLDEYRAFRDAHPRSRPFPGGESRDDAALRYAEAWRLVAARPERTIVVVCHEIPVRYALNAAAGSEELDGPRRAIPNATPFLLDAGTLAAAAARIGELAG
jgi:2,3-bisphosphoglycerate-dependent phosphoglycerate mutase